MSLVHHIYTCVLTLFNKFFLVFHKLRSQENISTFPIVFDIYVIAGENYREDSADKNGCILFSAVLLDCIFRWLISVRGRSIKRCSIHLKLDKIQTLENWFQFLEHWRLV